MAVTFTLAAFASAAFASGAVAGAAASGLAAALAAGAGLSAAAVLALVTVVLFSGGGFDAGAAEAWDSWVVDSWVAVAAAVGLAVVRGLRSLRGGETTAAAVPSVGAFMPDLFERISNTSSGIAVPARAWPPHWTGAGLS